MNPSEGKAFFTLEEVQRIELDKIRLQKTKNDSLINQFLEEEFTEEEIAFLKANWTPAK